MGKLLNQYFNISKVINMQKFIMLVLIFNLCLPIILSGTEKYYCYYATTFDRVTSGSDDIVFNNLKNKLTNSCQFEEKNIYYGPKQASTKMGINMVFKSLLNIKTSENSYNHLMVVLNGFATDDSCFYTIPYKGKQEKFNFLRLSEIVLNYPIESVHYLLNFKCTKATPGLIDSIANTIINNNSKVPQSLFISLYDSATDVQNDQLLINSFTNGITGGANKNFDEFIKFNEMTDYLDFVFQNHKTKSLPLYISKSSRADSFELIFQHQIMPSFELETLDGDVFHFDSTKNQNPAIILIGATYCLPCDAEKKDMLKIYKQNKKKLDVIYISIDLPDKLDLIKKKAKGFPFTFLLDPGGAFFSKITPQKSLPLTIVTNNSGKILYKKHGYNRPVDKNVITHAILELIKN